MILVLRKKGEKIFYNSPSSKLSLCKKLAPFYWRSHNFEANTARICWRKGVRLSERVFLLEGQNCTCSDGSHKGRSDHRAMDAISPNWNTRNWNEIIQINSSRHIFCWGSSSNGFPCAIWLGLQGKEQTLKGQKTFPRNGGKLEFRNIPRATGEWIPLQFLLCNPSLLLRHFPPLDPPKL